jgi:hypothetical protein
MPPLKVNKLGASRLIFECDWAQQVVLLLGRAEGAKMYKRILLAYDGSVEAAALREGALLGRQCGAKVLSLIRVS